MDVTRLDRREIGDIGNQLSHPGRVFVKLLYESLAVFRVFEAASLERISIRDDRGQRRSQLMGKVSEEFPANALQPFKLGDVKKDSCCKIGVQWSHPQMVDARHAPDEFNPHLNRDSFLENLSKRIIDCRISCRVD